MLPPVGPALAAVDCDVATIRRRLEVAASQLSARRDALARQHAQAQAAATQADQRLEMSEDVFRSSSDGLAESLRSIEEAAMSRQPAAVIRRLQRLHVNAEEASAQEYQRRAAAWGHVAGDGPLRACPLGTDPALAVLALADRIMATYRADPGTRMIRVRLLRVVHGERLRMTVQMDRRTELTVCGVLRAIVRDAQLQARLARGLRVDAWDYADAVVSA